MEYEIVTSLEALPSFDLSLPLFADIETDDLYGPLRMIQLYQPHLNKVYIYDLAPLGYSKITYAKQYQELKDYLLDKHLVFYNGSYDLGTMNISPKRVDDLFYLVKLAYPEFMEFKLKKIVKKLPYCADFYKGIDLETIAEKFVLGAYLPRQAYRYGALDVFTLSLIWGDKKIQLQRENNISYKVDMLSQQYALVYQQNGMIVDHKLREAELEKTEASIAKWSAMLPKGFNPNSFKQVRALLNVTESDYDALIGLVLSKAPNGDVAEAVIGLRKSIKRANYLKSINFAKMYTKFNVAGAISGRFTSAGGCLVDHFNSQQIPRALQYLFTQPTEDTVVIDADYSTLELRLAAGIYGDEFMYNQLKNGRDLHTDMAMLVTGKPLHADGILPSDPTGTCIVKDDRDKAKAVNFGFVFGMSAKSFQSFAYTDYGISYTEAEAVTLRKEYFKQYRDIQQYHNYVWENYKNPRFTVSTALGRRVKPKLGTDGINIPIQGTGAETTKLAVHYLIKDYGEEALQYIYNVVHDAIYLRVPRGIETQWAEALNKSMIKAWVEISKTNSFKFKDIPMIAEVEINA